MNVLGLHAFGHHTGAAVMTPDSLVAISEERLTRIKNDGSFPREAIRYCLKAAGVGAESIDAIVYDKDFGRFPEQRLHHNLLELEPHLEPAVIQGVEHHVLHAWGAIAMSGLSDAAVMVLDGGGSLVEEGS